jgi:tetratricopeptide (TPR) repeat protein
MRDVVRAVARAGDVHVLRGTPQEGLALLHAELALPLDALDDGPAPSGDLAPAYLACAWLLNACGRYAEALPVATLAAQIAREQGDTAGIIQADLRRSQLLLMLGQLDAGMSLLREVIPLAEAADDLRSLRLALNSLGWAHEARGEFEQDAMYTERAYDAARRLGDPTVLAFMTSNRGGPAFNVGDWRTARQAFEEGLSIMRPFGTTWASAWPPLLLGRLELAEGEQAMGEAHLSEAIELARQSDDLQALRWAHAALAERDLLYAAPDAARDRLLPLMDRPNQQESDVTPLLPLVAWAYLDLDDLMRAESFLHEAVARATAAGMRPTLVQAWRIRALLWQRCEQWSRAEADLASALAASRRMHHHYAQAILRFERGRLALHRGRLEQARTQLTAAQHLLTALSERLYLGRVEGLLNEMAAPAVSGAVPRSMP